MYEMIASDQVLKAGWRYTRMLLQEMTYNTRYGCEKVMPHCRAIGFHPPAYAADVDRVSMYEPYHQHIFHSPSVHLIDKSLNSSSSALCAALKQGRVLLSWATRARTTPHCDLTP